MNGICKSATFAKNQYVQLSDRTIAYRSIGCGQPILLCTRFRGTLDLWDPAFLDALANRGFQVITFDYTGLGLSSGEPTYSPPKMAEDVRDLIEALKLQHVVLAGWSIGGMAAQCAYAFYPQNISHLVLIGTTPPGELVKMAEPLFYDVAGREKYDFDDVVILFFEPLSVASRNAAELSQARILTRTDDLSPDVPIEFARSVLVNGPSNPAFPAPPVLEALKNAQIPILHLGGDHDIIFPVENWYALNQQLPTLTVLTFPSAGHGPHHQFPIQCADMINSFVRN